MTSSLILSIVLLASAPVGTPRHVTAKEPAARSSEGASATKVDGRIARYLQSPDGQVDGVVLQDGTVARFAPRRRGLKTATPREGDRVRVQGDLVRGLPGPYLVHASVSQVDQLPPAPSGARGRVKSADGPTQPDDMVFAEPPQLHKPSRLKAAERRLKRLTSGPDGRTDAEWGRRQETKGP
jgi:hypothetical protein